MIRARLKGGIIFTTITCLLFTISGCATYKSSFNCGDAKGTYCASMDHVDQMIDSGEIENYNEQRLKKKHKKRAHHAKIPLKTNIDLQEVKSYEVDDAGN
jgi:hypothetical protein